MSEATAAGQASTAGRYDSFLGGTAHSAADRAAGAKIRAGCPEVVDATWANRGFRQRPARWLAARPVTFRTEPDLERTHR